MGLQLYLFNRCNFFHFNRDSYYKYNKKIIRATDFYRPEEREPAAFDFAEETPVREEYPILLTHEGMKKFITHFENRLNQRVLCLPKRKRMTYRDICLGQVRLLARHLNGEAEYKSYMMR